MMKLSHILYKVDNLEEAVKEFADMGFTVAYGANPKKATNAMIWFEEGPFIELFTVKVNPVVYSILKGLLKLTGKNALLKRIDLYKNAPKGFCDVSIETEERELKKYTDLLAAEGYACDRTKGRRTNLDGEKLNWQLAAPPSLDIPFLMSAYNIKQGPKKIKHRNGALSIEEVIFATDNKNRPMLNKLVQDERLKFVEGSGIMDIKIKGWDHEMLHQH